MNHAAPLLAALALAALALAASARAAPALAQTPASGQAPAGQTCVQITMNGQSGPPYNCLNQQLQQLAQSARTPPAPPLAATSPTNATGTFNEAGIAEQYGKNFGASVTPYRPPAPVFTNDLH